MTQSSWIAAARVAHLAITTPIRTPPIDEIHQRFTGSLSFPS
jgi:hypothetical protein